MKRRSRISLKAQKAARERARRRRSGQPKARKDQGRATERFALWCRLNPQAARERKRAMDYFDNQAERVYGHGGGGDDLLAQIAMSLGLPR